MAGRAVPRLSGGIETGDTSDAEPGGGGGSRFLMASLCPGPKSNRINKMEIRRTPTVYLSDLTVKLKAQRSSNIE